MKSKFLRKIKLYLKMEILSLTLEIRFKQNTSLTADGKIKKLVEIVTGKSPKEEPPAGTMMVEIGDNPSKTKVIIQGNRIAIAVEQPNASQSKERLIELLKSIYKEVNFEENSIDRIGVRTQWIQEWNGSFTSLMEKYRAVFYQKCSLVNEASDIAVSLTLEHDNYKVNYNSGPVRSNEAKEKWLVFKERNIPHDFILVDIDRYASENVPTNNLIAIKQFILDSIKYGQNKTTETINILTE
jgi:hypothetical protein